MLHTRVVQRAIPRICRLQTRAITHQQRVAGQPQIQTATSYAARRQLHFLRAVFIVVSFGTVATAWQTYNGGRIISEARAEGPDALEDAHGPEIVFEEPKKTRGLSKEETRDIISSQHLQVKRSWENPGVYAWGSNSGKVVAPDSDELSIKTPRRIKWFDGVLLRDMKLDRYFGAAINEHGDLLQWGTGYASDVREPTITLSGKDLKSLSISRDRIIGLATNGTVYSVPVSRDDQVQGAKLSESSWIPFWRGRGSISYRKLEPQNLQWGEYVTNIAGGLEHVLLLTSKGRVFSAASGSEDFPNRGQLGIPGLTWLTRPPGAYDQCHEISTLKGFEVDKIAAGDHHSIVSDRDGRVFTFGDNSLGQLGFDFTADPAFVDAPSLLPIQRMYAGTNQTPQVTGIAAGGANSFFTIDATRVASPTDDANSLRSLGRVTADTWSCGHGIWGGLGNGKWTHVQGTPAKIPSLSGLFEYDEINNRAIPIRIARISVGATHAAIVMDNVTYLNANRQSSDNDTNWGADIVFFGSNEYYQLGTGRRNNVSNPVYINALDQLAERTVRGREEHRFQITPRKTVKIDGRNVSMEQRIECGRFVTAVYSGL